MSYPRIFTDVQNPNYDATDPPCQYQGEQLSAAEKIHNGLVPLRVYYKCGRGYGNPPPFVSPCRECNRHCPGYVPIPEADC